MNKKEGNVVIVFEAACDAHWMKDVVQFPNALANELFGKEAILIARPNNKQEEIAKHINLLFYGRPIEENEVAFEISNFSTIKTEPIWYLQACKKAATMGSTLILYPWFGNAFKGAFLFKLCRWSKFKKAAVIMKTDGLLQGDSTHKASFRKRIKDRCQYFFIDKIIIENSQVYKDMGINNAHFSSKLIYLPNCPLDIYHEDNRIPYPERANKFLFVGRFDDLEKGANILMEAWLKIAPQIPGWQLDIVGPCSPNIKKKWTLELEAAKLLHTVQWFGKKKPEELIYYFRNTKIVVCSSKKESGPIILSESILCGCSFIGRAVGEIPEVLKGLPGLVQNEDTLEKQMLLFAQHPEIAGKQAEALFERMKDRKWSVQVKRAGLV
ncbi:MAG: glycosyltransferase family 4 protein [Ginsengibacter sp.]